MPSANHDQQIEDVHKDIEKTVSKFKGDEKLIVLGDMNTLVEGKEEGIVGTTIWGRKITGDRLVECCSRNHLMGINTWFNCHKKEDILGKCQGISEDTKSTLFSTRCLWTSWKMAGVFQNQM